MSDRTVRWLTLGLLAVLGIYSLWRLDLTWSITYFLPSRDDAKLVDLSLELIDSSLAHRMVLAVGGAPDRGLAAAKLADSLRSHPEVAWVADELDEHDLRSLYELYFERRIYLASDSPEIEIPEMLRLDSLEDRAERLRLRLRAAAALTISLSLFAADKTRYLHALRVQRGRYPMRSCSPPSCSSAQLRSSSRAMHPFSPP